MAEVIVADPIAGLSESGVAYIEKINELDFCLDCPMTKVIPEQWNPWTGGSPSEVVCPCDFDFTDPGCYRHEKMQKIIDLLSDADSLLAE